MRSAAIVVVVVVLLATSGCGSSTSRTIDLRSVNPLTADLYIKITGPKGAVSYVARGINQGLKRRHFDGFIVVSAVQGQKDCSYPREIGSADSAALQRWQGSTITIAVYGSSDYAPQYCEGIAAAQNG